MSNAMIEAVEARRLMSVSLNPATKILTANGTPGADTILVQNHSPTHIKATVNGVGGIYAKAKVAKVVMNGFAGPDSLRSTDKVTIPHAINGGTGVDFLRGGGGDDVLNAGDGNDLLDGGWGADMMRGNAGVDTVDYSHRTENLRVYLLSAPHAESGSLEHDITVTPYGLIGDLFGSDVENCRGGSGNDEIWGSAANNTIWGNAGNDTIHGIDGNDTLVGGAGKDELYGNDGSDVLDARDGSVFDKVDGGAGFDLAKVDKWVWPFKMQDQTTAVEWVM